MCIIFLKYLLRQSILYSGIPKYIGSRYIKKPVSENITLEAIISAFLRSARKSICLTKKEAMANNLLHTSEEMR